MARTPEGSLHIAWTCLACEFINCWNWEPDEGADPLGPSITMTCDNCGRETRMMLVKE